VAKIFLSYSRSDFERIEPLAKVLEKEGHSVWWDRRLKGGSEFDAVIERALADAEFVVVAWSEAASRSPWVRDEAAAGRDRHCLVPVVLDGSRPPLGFRQFQTVDLSRWKGRGHPPQLNDLIEALSPSRHDVMAGRPSVELRKTRKRFRVPRVTAAAALAILLVTAIGGGWWWASHSFAHNLTLAIEAGNSSEKSQEVARELAAELGDLQSAGAGGFQLVSDNRDADFTLQINAADDAKGLRRDLSLLSGRSILWSTTMAVESYNADDLAQQLPLLSKQMLSCAFGARQDAVDPPTFKLYLRGCAQLSTSLLPAGNYDTPAVNLFQQVVRNAPHFEAGWAKLLLATEAVGQTDDLKDEIAQAEKVGMKPGELYAAKAGLEPPQNFLSKLSLLDRAIEIDPDNADLYRRRADELASVGRMKVATSDAARALQLDPFSLDSQYDYIFLLADSGEIEQATEQLNARAMKWSGLAFAGSLNFAFYEFLGDPKQAFAIYQDGVSVTPSPADEDFILARIDPTPAKIQRAIDEFRVNSAQHPRRQIDLLQILGEFGRVDEAIDLMLHYTGPDTIIGGKIFRPSMRNVWRDARSMDAAAHLGILRYWKDSGHWPDFCFEPDLPYDCKKVAAKVEAKSFLPLRPPTNPPGVPDVRSTAKCHDGAFSSSLSKSGACGLHGGVEKWLSSTKPS
jgi:tetratricopeptide (TPR) repeat protein